MIRISDRCPSGCVKINAWLISCAFQIAGAKMVSTTASVGKEIGNQIGNKAVKSQVFESIGRLSEWLARNDYRGYDTFDGLEAYLRPLTLETNLLRTVLQQGVRRFPLNLRPILGIPKRR